MLVTRSCTVLLAALLWTASAHAQKSQGRKLQPTDDATRDPGFFTFRSQLLQALHRRDTTFLYSIMAPEIKNSFGGDDSIAGFKRMWKLEPSDSVQPASSPVWETLTRVLSLGGKLTGQQFQAPYVYARWPDAIDPFEFVAIVGENVGVRSIPQSDAPRFTILSFDIVAFKEWKGLGENALLTPDTWAQVELPDGRSGWVQGRYVYSPTSWRAIFEKRNGRWLLITFVAGD